MHLSSVCGPERRGYSAKRWQKYGKNRPITVIVFRRAPHRERVRVASEVTALEQQTPFWAGTQNQEVGPQRALRGPVAAEDSVLR